MCIGKLLRCIVFQPPRPATYSEDTVRVDHWARRDGIGGVGGADGGGAEATRLPVVAWSNPELLLPLQLRKLLFPEHELGLRYPGTTILYSHGNGEDAGQISAMLRAMARVCKANVFGYDYTGYGLAAPAGRPMTEESVYADAEAVYRLLVDELGVPPGNIVLYGRSMGSGPTMHLASRVQCKAVVLQSPMLSLVRTHCSCLVCCGTWDADMFANIDRVNEVKVPVYVIHGMKDRVVPFWHGKRLHELLPSSEEPTWIREGDHNNMRMSSDAFFNLVKRFLYRVDARRAEADAVIAEHRRAARRASALNAAALVAGGASVEFAARGGVAAEAASLPPAATGGDEAEAAATVEAAPSSDSGSSLLGEGKSAAKVKSKVRSKSKGKSKGKGKGTGKGARRK